MTGLPRTPSTVAEGIEASIASSSDGSPRCGECDQRWRTATGPTTAMCTLATGCHTRHPKAMPERGDGRRRDSPPVRWAPTLLLAVVVTTLAACNDGDGGDTEAFCSGVAENVEALRATPATDQ